MAIANTIQTIIDTQKRTVIKRVGIIDSDENETVIIDPRTLSNCLNANGAFYQTGNTTAPGFANSAFTVARVLASVDAEVGHIQIKWQGTTSSATLFALGVGTTDTNPVGPTGNLTIKSVGTTTNAAYTVIIELHKNGQYFNGGQLNDPAAFNYPPYGNLNT